MFVPTRKERRTYDGYSNSNSGMLFKKLEGKDGRGSPFRQGGEGISRKKFFTIL
jgi:hypothetical protein